MTDHELDHSKCKCSRCFSAWYEANQPSEEERRAKLRAKEAAEDQYYDDLADLIEGALLPKSRMD